MSLYGDNGNVITLQKRAEWRGIDLEVFAIEKDAQQNLDEFDLFFIGGGQDRQQALIADDFLSYKEQLQKQIDQGKSMLAICGGYQLLGKYYQTSDGQDLAGLDILEIFTKAPCSLGDIKQDRLIGNVSSTLVEAFELSSMTTLVGFENHCGRTFIQEHAQHTKPLAKINQGFGNNAEDSFEGVRYRNLIGTYLHGSVLPKNPHLALMNFCGKP